MDKVQFVKDVFGENFPKEYIKNVDNVLDFLPYNEQLVIRLKYNKVPFTKLCRLMQKRTSWGSYRFKSGGISPCSASTILQITMQKLKRDSFIKRIWEGEVYGDVSKMGYSHQGQ
jgi:hypothetical protein